MAALGNSAEPTDKRLAQVGVVFYASRLKMRDPRYDFSGNLKRAKDQLIGHKVSDEVQRCAPEVINTMKQLDAAQHTLNSR
jgi:hypothetical protein